MKKSFYNMVLGGAAFAIVSSTAKSAIIPIYQDYFDNPAGIIANRTPDLASGQDGGTGGVKWTSDTATSADPDALWNTAGGTYTTADSTFAYVGSLATGADGNLITNSYLPFVPQTNQVYDLHIDLLSSSTGASGNWMGLAFVNSTLNGHTGGGSSSALSNDGDTGLMLDKGSGAIQYFTTGTSGAQNASVTAGSWVGLDIFLDTTGAQWKESWAINGVASGTPYTFTTNPSIGNVVFGTNKITGEASNFSLTAIPEPASLWVISLGTFGLLRRKPRQA